MPHKQKSKGTTTINKNPAPQPLANVSHHQIQAQKVILFIYVFYVSKEDVGLDRSSSVHLH